MSETEKRNIGPRPLSDMRQSLRIDGIEKKPDYAVIIPVPNAPKVIWPYMDRDVNNG